MIFFSRLEWKAAYGSGASKPGLKPTVVIHHSKNPDIRAGVPHQEEAEMVRAVEKNHATINGWSGIAYNFVVFQSGHVYEGRGWDRVGAHAKGRNSTSVGICLFIDGDEHTPTRAAVKAIQELIQEGIATGRIAQDYQIVGHRDVWATDCPGNVVYQLLQHFRP